MCYMLMYYFYHIFARMFALQHFESTCCDESVAHFMFLLNQM